MLGIEEVDYSISEVFQNRTAAIKQVLNKMTFAEREEVDAKVAIYKNLGLPEDIQRRLVLNFFFVLRQLKKLLPHSPHRPPCLPSNFVLVFHACLTNVNNSPRHTR
jgi:hypothetical protein